MKCIIVDDEPIARLGIKSLIEQNRQLELLSSFDNAESAAEFMESNATDLVFLDIQMPGINGIEFARSIPKTTLIIFTTAYSEFALDSYEVDAVDYLVKPIELERFEKSVNKAVSYHSLLMNEEKDNIEEVEPGYIFVKSDRKFCRVNFTDILFIEGLKDYIIIQTESKRIITKMYLKTIIELLPQSFFFRINRSYIVNLQKIESFDNNDVFIDKYEIAIGNGFREDFFKRITSKKA